MKQQIASSEPVDASEILNAVVRVIQKNNGCAQNHRVLGRWARVLYQHRRVIELKVCMTTTPIGGVCVDAYLVRHIPLARFSQDPRDVFGVDEALPFLVEGSERLSDHTDGLLHAEGSPWYAKQNKHQGAFPNN